MIEHKDFAGLGLKANAKNPLWYPITIDQEYAVVYGAMLLIEHTQELLNTCAVDEHREPNPPAAHLALDCMEELVVAGVLERHGPSVKGAMLELLTIKTYPDHWRVSSKTSQRFPSVYMDDVASTLQSCSDHAWDLIGAWDSADKTMTAIPKSPAHFHVGSLIG